jgi:hypothetical protein
VANSNYLKLRPLPTPSRLNQNINQATRAATRNRTSFEPKEGQWNNFYPRQGGSQALWFAMCPQQKWTSEIYDREVGEVVKLEDSMYYAYVTHRVNQNNRNFTCSAGAYKDKPCWGCGIRNAFYDRQREKEEATGVKLKGEAPINAVTQYAFAGVLLEHVAKVQVTDDQGKPKLNREGKAYFRDVPLPLIQNQQEARRLYQEGSTTFGLPVHWSVGITHLNTINSIDRELVNYCRWCAGKLNAVEVVCPNLECGEVHTPTEVTISNEAAEGQALTKVREEIIKCSCGYEGVMIPMIECAGGCEEPTEGQLTDFAIRLYAEKSGETKNDLKWAEIRPIRKFLEKFPAIEQHLLNPLNVADIHAPTPLSRQTFMVPENLRGDGVSPEPKKKRGQPDAEPLSQPYSLGGGTADDEDDGHRGNGQQSNPWEV